MLRLIVSFLVFWLSTAMCIYMWAHMTTGEQATVGKSILFGFITAVITGVAVAGLVVLF